MSVEQLPDRRAQPPVNVSSIHNALARNHLIDVLQHTAAQHALSADAAQPAAFASRMRALSAEFRRQVTGAVARRVGLNNVHCLQRPSPDDDNNVPALARLTRRAMLRRHHMIVHPVLLHAPSNTYAQPPFLLRADIAHRIFDLPLPDSPPVSDAAHLSHLYLVVAVKRRPVHTANRATIRANSLHKVQKYLYLCNQILHHVQPNSLPLCLLFALNPNRTLAVALGAHPPSPHRTFNSAVWKLALVPTHALSDAVRRDAIHALQWRIDVVDNSAAWLQAHALQKTPHRNPIHALLQTTSDPRLRPNMKCPAMYDWPWHSAKAHLAHHLNELTLISGLSVTHAHQAMAKAIPNDFAHPQVTADALRITTQFATLTLEKSKPHYNGPPVTPQRIPHNKSNWRLLQHFKPNQPHNFDEHSQMLPHAEQRSFYVDFELVSAEYLFADKCTTEQSQLDPQRFQTFDPHFDVYPTDPFYQNILPDALIYLIGCGQLVRGTWSHRVFVADTLDIQGERNVVTHWLQHMQSSIPRASGNPLVHVWGPEKQLLRQAFGRMPRQVAEQLQPLRNFHLIDMHKVVTTSCVSIKGSFNNSINNVANALHALRLLDDSDERESAEQVANGGDAMAAALLAAEWARSTGASSLSEADVMKHVVRYNEQDCRDIARIASYLRKNH